MLTRKNDGFDDSCRPEAANQAKPKGTFNA